MNTFGFTYPLFILQRILKHYLHFLNGYSTDGGCSELKCVGPFIISGCLSKDIFCSDIFVPSQFQYHG